MITIITLVLAGFGLVFLIGLAVILFLWFMELK